ncbi:MAG: prolipoprotein diacylglyceryl transferase [Thermoanaerobaculum sp.]|nr:prolipoprotein diacylglyceryl transferase [Thermoanaerobaculum sp.]
MHPFLVDLGFFALPTYGVFLALGLVAGLWTARSRAKRAGLPPDKVVDLGVWVVFAGLLGGKLLLVVAEPGYLTSLQGWVSLLRAGGVFYGGLLGALAAAALLVRRWRLPFWPLADTVAPSIALGHAFGRLGCFFAGCCYGASCSAPWAVVFSHPKAAEISGTPLGIPLHPTQLYEAGFNLLNYLFLAWLFRRQVPRRLVGQVLGFYLANYGVARFVIEFFRGDADRGFLFGGLLSTSQGIAAVLVPVGVFLILRGTRRARPAP